MARHTVSNGDDVIDSRDVIARISELESKLQDTYDAQVEAAEHAEDCARRGHRSAECTCEAADSARYTDFEEWLNVQADDNNDDATELLALRALQDDAAGYCPDWRYGATLICDSYFETYAQELHEDINGRGATGWPYDYIDWEQACDALKQDYTQVVFDGVTYWVR